MKCPFCGYTESRVIDSRPTDEYTNIRRRRECLSCQKRFTTYESVETLPIVVIKKDGRREIFDRNKIMRGLMRSCDKRPVPMAKLEALVDEIEQSLSNSLAKEVPSTRIGEFVMDGLKNLDEIAYVRFASVYRQFKDINSFMDELQQLIRDK